MKSKFGFLKDAKNRAAEPEPGPPAEPPVTRVLVREEGPREVVAVNVVYRDGTPVTSRPSSPPSPAPRRPGRPKGKRSDPSFEQVSAYIPGDLHHGVKLALLQERQGREFSELVTELLTGWLNNRPIR